MAISSSIDKSAENTQTPSSIDPLLNELVTEVKDLFKVIDSTSNKIRELESCLRGLKAHFPFRYYFEEEQGSQVNLDQKYPQVPSATAQFYSTQTYRCLSWEQDESFKNFRLFLIDEERDEITYCIDRCALSNMALPKTLSKKPFIETDLPTRLRYSEYIVPFINAFKKYIVTCRTSIESKRIISDSDDLPF